MKNKDFWKTMIQLLISILTAALTAMGTTSCMGRGPLYEPTNLARTVAVADMVNKEYPHDCANAFAPSGRISHPLFTQGVALGYELPAPSGRNTLHPHTQGVALGYELPAPSGRNSLHLRATFKSCSP